MQDLQKEILSGYDIVIRTYEDNTIEKIPDFLKKVDIITSKKDDSIIQLLDSDYICGIAHLNQGISQAIKAFDEKQNFANDKGLEICVRTSAQKQISQALKVLGIKTSGNITVVYINVIQEQIEEVEVLLGKRNDELLEVYDENIIMETYKLTGDVDIVNSINEKIALLALKN